MKYFFTKLFLLIALITGAQDKNLFRDTTDGAFDVSNFLATRTGFMPVPTIITEPAIGYGGGLFAIFFHRSKEEKATRKYNPWPPSLTVAGGLATENGTWAAFAAHQGVWNKDKMRYFGLTGYSNLNMAFYFQTPLNKDLPFKFNFNGIPFYQELAFKINKSKFFIGGAYFLLINKLNLSSNLEIPENIVAGKEITSSGLTLLSYYDTRDNMFTPNSGIRVEYRFSRFDEFIGSDFNFFRSNLKFFGFYDKIPKSTTGFRISHEYAWGDVPFYQRPSVAMRGIPAMRHQDDMVISLECEERWDFYKRWALVGFGGSGFIGENLNSFDWDPKWAIGGGGRYYLASAYKLYAGLDIAFSEEQWAWYITVGNSWFR